MTLPDPSRALLKSVEDRDPEALEQLYNIYGEAVFRSAFSVTNNSADADDVRQDVFLGLAQAVGKYSRLGSFEGWIRKVAIRTALMKLRKRRRRREVAIDKAAPIAVSEGGPATEDRIVLDAAVAALTEEQRLVFVMRAVEGHSHAEIGELLGISSLASRSRFHRAMEQVVESCKERKL